MTLIARFSGVTRQRIGIIASYAYRNLIAEIAKDPELSEFYSNISHKKIKFSTEEVLDFIDNADFSDIEAVSA